jgi:eukaryotic-like serine/threonine-protein kinase
MKLRNIGRYQVKQEVDQGGMSVVYLAHDPRFRRDVAIKVLSRNLQGQANIRARFEREARIIATLDHPAIVTVYDYGEDDGAPFLVMRYMPGGSLADLLTYGRLNLTDSAAIAERMGGALDVAHGKGIIHRDLKPANILFDAKGEAFLSDFGIVKMFEDEPGAVNMTGSVVLGTPAYMSPEQALGKQIDRRSDVYSLGAVIYEMLTGVPPYKGPSSVSIAMKHVMDPVPHVREYRQDVPEEIDALVAKAMSKEASDRHDTAGALAGEFARAVRALPAVAQTAAAPPAASRKPITEARARASNTPAAPISESSEASYSGNADTQFARNRSALTWIAGIAAVLGAIGIAAALAATLISNNQTPAVATASPEAPGRATDVVAPTDAPAAPTAAQATVAAPAAPEAPTVTVPPSATPEPAVRSRTNEANIRSGPGVAYDVIGQMRQGDVFLIVALANGLDGIGWYEIKLNTGARGFVRSDVVVVQGAAGLDNLPASVNVPPAPTALPTPSPTFTAVPSPTPTRTPTPGILATSTPIPVITVVVSATPAPTSALTTTGTPVATVPVTVGTPSPTPTSSGPTQTPTITPLPISTSAP